MPEPTIRPSLKTDLETRYSTQHAGGAFSVKERLNNPGQSPKAGSRMPIDGNEKLYSNDDFVVKQVMGVTELLDAAESNNSSSPKSKEISMYIKGFNSKKYKP